MLNYSSMASGFKGKHTVNVVATISALYSDYNRLFVIIPFNASLDGQKHVCTPFKFRHIQKAARLAIHINLCPKTRLSSTSMHILGY